MYDTPIDLLQKGGSKVSTLLGVKHVGVPQVAWVVDGFEMSMDTVMQVVKDRRPLEVPVRILGIGERLLTIYNLRLIEEGWNAGRVEGVIFEKEGCIRAQLCDNPSDLTTPNH